MAWILRITSHAERDLARLPARTRGAIRDALERAAAGIGTADIRKLEGARGRWRLRVGEMRAILEFDNRQGLIILARVFPHGRAYRR